MRKFAVGEIALAIYKGTTFHEVEIISYTEKARFPGENIYWIHDPLRLSSAPSGNWYIREKHLRKKRSPEEDRSDGCYQKTTWDKCLWRPKEVEVKVKEEA